MMATTPSAQTFYGQDSSGTTGYYALGGAVSIPITTATLSTGSTGDLVTVATGLSRYVVSTIYAESLTASGTLALATIDIRTSTGGGGTSILTAPVALTGLTTTNLTQSLGLAALGSVLTAANLTLRQTVVSGNSGTIGVVIILIPLP